MEQTMVKLSSRLLLSVFSLAFLHTAHATDYTSSLEQYNYEGKYGTRSYPIEYIQIKPVNRGMVTTSYEGYSYYDHNKPDQSFDLVKLKTSLALKPIPTTNDPSPISNYYDITIYSWADGSMFDNNYINVIGYSPGTTGVINSYSSGTSWDINANIGFFGDVPTGGIGGSIGGNKGFSETLPSIQILTQKNRNSVRWRLRIEGNEEAQNDFSIDLTTTWKISSQLRDNPAYSYKYAIPFSVYLQSGTFSTQVINKDGHVLPAESNLLALMMAISPAAALAKAIFTKDDSATYAIQTIENPSVSAGKVDISQPLPPREHSWFLAQDQIVSDNNLCPQYQYPSLTQKGELLYGLYNPSVLGVPKIIYSSDGIYWRPSSSKLPDDFNSNNLGSDLIYDGKNLMFISKQQDPTTRLYILEDGASQWASLTLPSYVDINYGSQYGVNAMGPSLCVFKNRLHIAYPDKSGNDTPTIVVNLGGESFTNIKNIPIPSPAKVGGPIALAATKDRLFACYRTGGQTNTGLAFAWSNDGYYNWHSTLLPDNYFKSNTNPIQDNTIPIRSCTVPSLLIKGDILYLIYGVPETFILRLHRYSLKTNQWNSNVFDYDTSLLRIKMPFDVGEGFRAYNFDMDESKIYLSHRDPKTGSFVTSFLIKETQYKKYQDTNYQ
jgi:hypothetical protein